MAAPPDGHASPNDSVAQALAATLSTDAVQRHAAEAALNQHATHDAHAVHLLQLAAQLDPTVAPAAALRLKNLVRASRDKASRLSDASREKVRSHILPALAIARATPVEGVLAETTRWLLVLDYPSRWPQLLPSLSQFLASNESPRVHAALIVLRQLVKCYEFRTRDPTKLDRNDSNDVGLKHPREPLDSLAAACFPTLLALYKHLDTLIANPPPHAPSPDRNHAALAQRLIVKIFWSCTQFMLPPCLADASTLDGWMHSFFDTLRRPTPHVHVDDLDDLVQEPEWKTKKWIAQILTRFLKRYGTPRKVSIDEPWGKAVATMFKDRHAINATTIMLEVLSSETNGHQLSKRVAHLALDFIEEAIESAQLWAVIHPHVDTLLTCVVFRYLRFSPADDELWLNDPAEYVRKHYDFTEDLTSPRMAASNLLTKMGDLRSKRTILPFLQHLLTAVLQPYERAAVGSEQRTELARQKAGAFASLAAVKLKLVKKQDLSKSFLSVLKTHVEPDLRSEYGFLRSEAVWLLGQVASCKWADFTTELGEVSLRGCVTLLQDSELPVQASAAGALQFLLEEEGAWGMIREIAPQLLERLLSVMDLMSDGYLSLLPAVDKLVERYPDRIMPLAVPVVQRLMAAFRQSSQGVLMDGDDGDDDLVFTAAQVLLLLTSMISAIGDWRGATKQAKAELLGLLEKEFEGLLDSMFLDSHQVFVEELLDVLGALVEQTGEASGTVSSRLLAVVPKMVKGFETWAIDYIENMMDAIEAYLNYGLSGLLTMDGGLDGFVRMILKLWTNEMDDGEAKYGARMAEVMMLKLSEVKPLSDELLQNVVVKVGRAAVERLGQTEDEEYALRQRLFCVVMLSCYVDAERVLKAVGGQTIMQLIGAQTGDEQLMDRVYTKKCAMMGVGAVLCTRGLIAEESKPHVVRLLVELQALVDKQREARVLRADGFSSGLAAASGDEHVSPFVLAGASRDGGGSDLEDDEDATNAGEELNEPAQLTAGTLAQIAERAGMPAELLLEANGSAHVVTGEALELGEFEFDDVDDQDEGAAGVSALDDVDEGAFVVRCVKAIATEPWWAAVPQHDRDALDRLAGRCAAAAAAAPPPR